MLPFDTDLLADVPGNDAVCIAPGTTRRLDVGVPAGTLVVRWTDRGPHTQGLIAARAQLAWADGRTTERNLFVGEHVGRPPAPTRASSRCAGSTRPSSATANPISGPSAAATRATCGRAPE